MPISSTKCTEFAVKAQYSSTGKPTGHAVVGRAKPHEKFEVVKHEGTRLIYRDPANAEDMRAELAAVYA